MFAVPYLKLERGAQVHLSKVLTLGKHGDLRLIPRIHMRMLVMVDHTCNSATAEEETSGSWGISGHEPS